MRMTFEEYRKIDAVNFSTLKAMLHSPAHYRAALNAPDRDLPAFALGRAVHTSLLEPDRLGTDYVAWSGGQRRGKEWEAFKAEHSGRTILRVEDLEQAMAIRDAVLRHPVAASYLVGVGLNEETLLWTDPATGIHCKARIDRLSPFAVIDLKTTRDVESQAFARAVASYGYHRQLAFYSRGARETYGKTDAVSVVIAVEKDPPFDVAVYRIDADALYCGDVEIGEMLARLAQCRAEDRWPGRYETEQTLSLPPWAFGRDDDDEGEE